MSDTQDPNGAAEQGRPPVEPTPPIPPAQPVEPPVPPTPDAAQNPPQPPTGAYAPAPGGVYQPPAGGYAPVTSYPPPTGAYPPPTGSYPPPMGSYPPPAGGVPGGTGYPPVNQYPPPGYGAAAPTPYPPAYGPVQPSGPKGMAIAALVLGIVSVVFFWVPFFAAVTGLGGIAAVVLGSIALARRLGGKGMSIAGIITGAIGALLSILLTVVWTFGIIAATHSNPSKPYATSSASPWNDDDGDDGDSDDFHSAEQNSPEPYGGTVTYDDGVTVSVAAGTPYTPQDPVWATQAVNLEYAVTVTNTTDDDIDINLLGEAVAGDANGDEILDKNLDVLKHYTLAAGESATYHLAFSVASADAVNVSVSLADDYGYAQFGD